MAYRNLMAFVEYDKAPEQRIRLVAELAGRFSSSIIGLSAVALRPPLVLEGVVVDQVSEAEIDEMKAKLTAQGDWLRKIAGSQRAVEWRTAFENPAAMLTREARSADLIVIGSSARKADRYTTLDAGEVVLSAGRPVLVIPKNAVSLRAHHIVVGWKDTREARCAVQNALPFLQLGTSVTVAAVCDAYEEESAHQGVESVARYLASHGLNAQPETIVRQSASDAAELVLLAGAKGADLLVTGAYGHTRMGEWIFGGMTRDLLTEGRICCLMSH